MAGVVGEGLRQGLKFRVRGLGSASDLVSKLGRPLRHLIRSLIGVKRLGFRVLKGPPRTCTCFVTTTTCISGLGFGVWGLGFGVWGLGFGVWGLGFGVWGLGQTPNPQPFSRDGGCKMLGFVASGPHD